MRNTIVGPGGGIVKRRRTRSFLKLFNNTKKTIKDFTKLFSYIFELTFSLWETRDISDIFSSSEASSCLTCSSAVPCRS